MPLTKAEKDQLNAEQARRAELDKETDEQKWLRKAMREESKNVLTELLGNDEDEESSPRSSGGNVSFLDGLFGKKTG